AFSLLLVVAVVLGGLGRIGGALIGSVLIVMLPWMIGTVVGELPLSADLQQRLSGNLPLLVFGALLVVVMLVIPAGLAGILPRRSVTQALRVDSIRRGRRARRTRTVGGAQPFTAHEPPTDPASSTDREPSTATPRHITER